MNPRALTVSVACALGFLTSLRALVAVDLPDVVGLVVLDPVPRDGFGMAWTELARFPFETRVAAARALLGSVGALLLAAGTAAALNAAIFLAEASTSRHREIAVRHAVGARPLVLARALLTELRTRLSAGLALGLVAGAAAGLCLRVTWPETLVPLRTGAVGPLPLDWGLGVAVLGLVLGAAHLSTLRSVTRVGRAGDALRAGARATPDPAAIFTRRALAAGHVAVSGAILISAIALASAVSQSRGTSNPDTPGYDVVTLAPTAASSSRRPEWAAVLSTVSALPGIEAESLAAPGALLGLGIHDIAVTECGDCWRGLFPAPLWNTLADHRAVTADFFAMNGLVVSDGRDFEPSDTEGEPVVIVNRRLAETAFEGGRPIGKRVRLGAGHAAWYRVVGVVDDTPIAGLGAPVHHEPAVYLNALQRPPSTGRLLLRGEPDAVAEAVSRVEALGFTATDAEPIEAWRARQSAPLGWARIVASVITLLSLLLATSGVRSVAIQIARRRIPDLAIRRALGASDRALMRTLLRERIRTAAWGLAGFVFLGTAATALVERGAGAAPPPLLAWVAAATLLLLASTGASLASLRVVREADPGHLIE